MKDGKIAFIGTVDELTVTTGARHTFFITTASGQQSFDTDDLAETLLRKLAEYKGKGITVLEVKTGRGTFEQHFMSIARSSEQ